MFAAKDALLTRPSGGGYSIARSVRLRSSASAYFNRTFGTPTNQAKWTLSLWIKRGTLSVANTRITGSSGSSDTADTYIYFDSSDKLNFSGGTTVFRTSSQVFRDPSAWYHIVLSIDTTQGTEANKILLYVNGVNYAWGSTSAITTCGYNTAHAVALGATAVPSGYLDGYLTEINFIDGQALTPSSFGSTNAVTGVWQPAKYTGTYGTNGFYLNFSSYATTAALGTDTSGNGNTWTVNNLSVTAGTTYDSMTDVPTLTSATAANYPTLNPLRIGPNVTLSQGNLQHNNNTVTYDEFGIATIGLPLTGKWYFEGTANSNSAFGVVNGTDPADASQTMYNSANTYLYMYTGNKRNNNTSTAYGATFTTNDIIGVAIDRDAGTITFYKNNTSQGQAFSGLPSIDLFFAIEDYGNRSVYANFGQRPFTYTPPTGYVALNTYNLPTSTITNGAGYMAATTYTGTGASLTVANTVGSASFQPDFVWVKGRSGATDHALYDSVRGTTKDLVSNSTAAETTQTTGLTAFGSTGFTVGALAKMNTSAATYVGWQWKGSGTTVSNTTGSITSTVCVNPTAGFSVVTYTGTGANATVGHGLGVAPAFIIGKKRNPTGNWLCWQATFGGTQYIALNTTGVVITSATVFNGSPTSTIFNLGTDTDLNANGATNVAYCWSEIAGFSRFGSYTGNASTDGTFVFTGFRPRWILIKSSTTTDDWRIYDTSRPGYNVQGGTLLADTAGAETTATELDILGNGFKARVTTTPNAAQTYIYAAFAESPFKNSLAR